MIRCGGVAEDLVDDRGDRLLARGEARHLGVGGVGQEEVDALLAEPGERAQVGDPAVERQLVHLEVAGVQHHPRAGADRDGQRVGDRVVDRDELEVERAEREPVALADLVRARSRLSRCSRSLESSSASVSLEPTSGMSPRSRSRYGVAPMWSSWPWVSTSASTSSRRSRIGSEVGQDQVDAGLVVLGEEHAAVDDQQPAVVLEDGHVAADLAEPAERDDPETALGQCGRCGELGVRMWLMRGPSLVRRRPDAASPCAQCGDLVVVERHQGPAYVAVVEHAEQLQRRLGGDRALWVTSIMASIAGSSRV